MASRRAFDVAVIGAGVFGAWTAYHLRRAGQRVVLLDAYGPGNNRSSSGDESRIIRMGYGGDEIYTRWAMRSLVLWKEFFARVGMPLFIPTGMLWLAREKEPYVETTQATLARLGVPFERLDRHTLAARFPQFALDHLAWGLLETESGALLARRAVQAVVEESVREGVEYLPGAVATPAGNGKLASVQTTSGEVIHAGAFVFACGPWLGKLFPVLLSDRIFPTRQEVFYFGVPAGETRFVSRALPTWILHADEVYGFPDIESRGIKIAFDAHGPAFDPDTGSRVAAAQSLATARAYVARRFPALSNAPIVETRVCQYENTSNGDFLIDRHPGMDNVWLVGGGSGHGFKHGPALGEYVAAQLRDGQAAEPRFLLATKEKVQHRAVY